MTKRWLIVVLTLGSLGLAAAAWMRLEYGVDFTDESYYAAMPYSFTLGNRPFVDEHTIHQTAAVLTTPLVRAYGTNEGLVLFLRRCWFGLALLTSLSVFLALRRLVALEAAIAAAIVPIAYMPFSVPALSYNTIGMLLLTVGLFASTTRYPAAAVIALAVACFAYPTLVVAAGPACIALFVLRKNDRRAIALAAIAATLAVALFVASVGLPALHDTLAYHRAFGVQGGGVGKLWVLVKELVRGTHPALAVLAIMAAAVPLRLRPFAVAALALGLYKDGGAGSSLTVVYAVVLFAPAVLRYARGPLLFIWITSAVAAIATAWTSANGLPNAFIGALPAFVAIIAVLGGGLTSLAFLALAAGLQLGAWRFVYPGELIPNLTRRVEHGPFAGLRTTPATLATIESIQQDLARFGKGRRTVLFYDDFPAGYLMSRLRPDALSAYTSSQQAYPKFDRTRYTRFYDGRSPDVVFEFRGPGGLATDVFRNYFWAHGARIAAERNAYTVYTRCNCPTVSIEAEAMTPQGNDLTAAWSSYAGDYSGGRAAITTKFGAEMSASIPNFRRGDYDVDLGFYSYGHGAANEIVIALGDAARNLRFTCGQGVHRVAGIRFRDVQTPVLSIRAAAIGQDALIIDRFVVRNADGDESIISSCATVGPETAKPEIVEAEEMGAERWTSYALPSYSAGRAAITTKPGAVITGTVPHFRPGDYAVTVSAYSYGGTINEYAMTVGGETQTIHVGPRQGVVQVPLEFRGVTSPRIAIRAVTIAQPAAIVDAVALQPLRAPSVGAGS